MQPKYRIEGTVLARHIWPYPGATFIDDMGEALDPSEGMCIGIETTDPGVVNAAMTCAYTDTVNIEVGDEYAYFTRTNGQWECTDYSVDIDPKIGVSVGLPEIEMDPTPYCAHCGAMQKANCSCPPDVIN